MTTHEIRKNIFVSSWALCTTMMPYCAFIRYTFEKKQKSIELTKDELISELMQISSIDNPSEFSDYKISQWDVLCIAIRHELKEATDKEIEHLFKL